MRIPKPTRAAGAARRAPRPRDRRLIAAVLLLVAFLTLAWLVPRPDPGEIRDWAGSAGAWFPLAFFAAHTLATVALPRLPFTLGARLLFGPVTGTAVAIAASTVSAFLAFALARAIGREAIASRLTRPGVAAVDRRLARRGWLAVGSLRLISPVPFPLVNYCAGVSSVRPVPFLVATAVGLLPGTVAVAALGDALTGRASPAMLVVSAICIALGVAGLVLDARLDIDRPETREARRA